MSIGRDFYTHGKSMMIGGRYIPAREWLQQPCNCPRYGRRLDSCAHGGYRCQKCGGRAEITLRKERN